MLDTRIWRGGLRLVVRGVTDAFQVTLSESFCLQYLSLGLWYSQPDNTYSLGPYQWSADHHRTVCMGRVLPVDWVSYLVMDHVSFVWFRYCLCIRVY